MHMCARKAVLPAPQAACAAARGEGMGPSHNATACLAARGLRRLRPGHARVVGQAEAVGALEVQLHALVVKQVLQAAHEAGVGGDL